MEEKDEVRRMWQEAEVRAKPHHLKREGDLRMHASLLKVKDMVMLRVLSQLVLGIGGMQAFLSTKA